MAQPPKQRVLRSGVTIAEKYRIDQAIARGGFSVIYRGTHIEMQRPVALKLLSIDDDIKPSWLERFTREARLASQLTHANTVTIFDYGQDPRGFLYIVMEWVEGVSLYQHLKKHGALSPPDVAEVTAQVLQSLGEAHQRGFLHRDLKPSNIMLSHNYDGDTLVKVLDFGIAKHLEGAGDTPDAARITHQGAFIGTPRYASPEQLDGKELTPAADIYSVGLLMWEALVGDPAVPAVGYGECVQKHLGDEPWQLPASVQCPPGLATILYRALEKPIDKRYQSCRQMRGDLAAWLQSAEASLEGGEDFFFATPSLGGREPAGLGNESTDVDKDKLFGKLGEQTGSQEPTSTEMHGRRGGGNGGGGSRLSSSPPADDSFERQLMAIVDDSSRQHTGANEQRGDSQRDSARSASGLRPDTRPVPTSHNQRSNSRGRSGATLAASALAATLVVGAGAYVMFVGGNFAGGNSADEPAPEAATTASEQASVDEQDDERPSDEAMADDGTPTYGADFIWRAISESQWRRIGDIDTLDFRDVTQSSARFRKNSMTVSVTIYETDSHLAAEEYLDAVEEPVQAVRFGKTAVQVSPGAKGSSTRGVYDLISSLFQLKSIARERVEDQ